MKKTILMLVVVAINFGAYAQSQYGNGKMNSDSSRSTSSSVTLPDGFVSKDGKTLEENDGKFTTLKHNVTLTDGTVVMTNGSYKTKDGTKMQLKEGDHLGLDGKLSSMDNTNKTNNYNQSNDRTNNNSDQQNNKMNNNQSNDRTNNSGDQKNDMNDNNMNNQSK